MVSNGPIQSHSPAQISGLVEASTIDVVVILTKNYNSFNNILFFFTNFWFSFLCIFLLGKCVTMLEGSTDLSHGD